MPSKRRTSIVGILAAQSHHKNKNSLNLFMIFPGSLLQKQQYINGLKHDVTIPLHSVVPVILHEFHNSKAHQGTIHTFEMIWRFYWWPKFHQDIAKHINRCDIHAKNLPNIAKYQQQHLEIPHVSMAALAMDIIGHLPVTLRGHWWALTTMCMYTSYVLAIPMKEKSAEIVVQAYLSGKSVQIGCSIAILSDNETEFKSTAPQWDMQTTWHQKIILKPISAPRQLKNLKCAPFP